MLEQQLVDYIKKAKASGQSDEQTRALLYKNGWAETEVSEAYASLNQPQPQTQPQQPQVRPQPQAQERPQYQPQQETKPVQTQVSGRPEVRVESSQPQQSYDASIQGNALRAQKSHTALKIFMVLIILAALGGAGYFVAGQYLNLPWNPFAPSPKTVVVKMVESMKNVKSSQTKTDVKVAITDNNNAPQGGFSFSISGGSDMTDASNPKINLSIASSVGTANPSADIIGLGNALYFKLNNVAAMLGKYSAVDFSQIDGKWLKLDQDSIKTLMEAQGGQVEVLDISQLSSTNSEYYKKLQGLVSIDIFSNYKKLQDQVVSGQATYHYLLTITKDSLKDLISKMIELQMQEAAKLQEGGEALDSSLVKNMAQAVVGTFVDAVGDINVEVWIGKSDYMLYQMKINKIIDASKVSPNASAKINIDFTSVSSEFNKPFNVSVPQDAQKIETILLPILKLQKISADMNQVNSVAQTVFSTNKSYSLLCSSGLLSGWLKMGLQGISNDIVSQGAKTPVCFAGPLGYCVSTQLASGSYLCIDEQGVLGKTRCISSATVCK